MVRNGAALIVFVGLVSAAGTSRAQPYASEQEVTPRGRLPLFHVGANVGIGTVPYRTLNTFSGQAEEGSESVATLLGGLQLNITLDAKPSVFAIDVAWNATSLGDSANLAVRGAANVTLPRILGGRTTIGITRLISSVQTGSTVTNTYETHVNKQVPLVYGLRIGTDVGLFKATSYEQGYTMAHKDSSALATLDVGYGMTSVQYDMYASAIFDVVSGSPGLRWGVRWAPGLIGASPFSILLEGLHLFGGDDRAVGTLFATSILIGSSSGVSF